MEHDTFIFGLKSNKDNIDINGFDFTGDYKVKNRFLRECLTSEEYEPSSVIAFKTLFSNKELNAYESSMEKDIYDFTLDEIIQWVKLRKYSNVVALRSDLSKITAYKTYCINKGIGKTNTNPLISVRIADLEKYVDSYAKEKKYITKNELFEIVSISIADSNDKLALILPFYGVMGRRYEDLLTLKKHQYDSKTQTITLNNKRKIFIDEKFFSKIIEKSIEDNEESCADNEYIIRGVKNKPLSPSSINKLLKNLKDKKLIEHITINSMFISGILYRVANEEIKQNKEFSRKEIWNFLDQHEGGKRSNLILKLLPFMRNKIRKEIRNGEEI